MIFPALLVALFFATLNFNHRVLYAPSDYQNEENFLRSLPRATYAEKIHKIEEEIAESGETDKAIIQSTSSGDSASSISYQDVVKRSGQATYLLAEDQIFRKLQNEYSSDIQREVRLGDVRGGYIFDGIVRDKGVTTIIEVRFVRSNFMLVKLRESLRRIQESAKFLPAEQGANFRVLLAIASGEDSPSQDRMAVEIDRFRNEFPFPIEVRFYKIADLEREFA
jgi:hypothetical protein